MLEKCLKKAAAGLLTAVLTAGMVFTGNVSVKKVYASETLKTEFSLYFAGQGWSEWSEDDRRVYRTSTYPAGFKAGLSGQPEGMSGTIQYAVNVSGQGWTGTFENGAVAGSESDDAPLEGIRVWLNGELKNHYDIYYRAMVQGKWEDWAMNGKDAGEAGVGKHIDGVRITVVNKGEAPKENTETGVVDPTKPMVALTFDDGPGNFEDRILTALESTGSRATFFMVGRRVAAHADAVKRMVQDGCELGNHTWDHPKLTRLSAAAIQAEIAQTNDVIQSAAGQPATVVRPPYGAVNDKVKTALAQMGYASVLWHIDTLDWKTRDTANTVNVVLSQVQDGDIILMHSIYEQSAAAAEQIIPELVNRGYQLVTVSELANARGGMTPGGVYGAFRP